MAKALSDEDAEALTNPNDGEAVAAEALVESTLNKATLKQEVMVPLGTIAGLRIESLADQEPFINGMLIYGESKTGKTRLACSAGDVPEMCPVLLVDCHEKGTRSVRKQRNVVAVKPTTEGQLLKLAAELRRTPGRFKTVIVDSLSEVQQQILREIMEKVIADPKNKMEDPEVPSMREWGILLVRLIALVKEFRDIPETHVIFTAGATISVNVDQRTKPKMITPDLNGQAAFKVPMRMDEVFYLQMKENQHRGTQQRVLQTAHTEQILCGSRSGELPEIITEPTMKKIFPLLIEKAKENK